MELNIFEDIIFGAIASIGFATISNPPIKVLPACGIIAGIGHGVRFSLLHYQAGLVLGSLVGAFVIGFMAVYASGRVKCPAESISFPALLPMIPGMYAYRMVEALVGCLTYSEEATFLHNLYLFSYNMMTTVSVILVMVVGITAPLFILKRLSFQATRPDGTPTTTLFRTDRRKP
ncbi:MAG: threonine/serine exporter family protein [Bacteroidales bacterium]|nr:threonine/serine exporter family protein [Bacteroidales bacterium]